LETFDLLVSTWSNRVPSIKNIDSERMALHENARRLGKMATFPDISLIIENKIRAFICFRLMLEEFGTLQIYGEAFGRDLCHKIFGSDPLVMLFMPTTQKQRLLICGETGTGKELLASLIGTTLSTFDSQAPKVYARNAAAFSEHLLDSELFGHLKGSFTGAIKNSPGILGNMIDGQSLFLDEITECGPSLQAKLLRVLQSGEYTPVGATKPSHRNFHLVAATNRAISDLKIGSGIRLDLYFRLTHRPPIVVPRLESLMSNPQQRPRLLAHLLSFVRNKELGWNLGMGATTPLLRQEAGLQEQLINEREKKLIRAVIAELSDYKWPGNLRECSALMERLLFERPENYERICRETRAGAVAPLPNHDVSWSPPEHGLRKLLEEVECREYAMALKNSKGSIQEAARVLLVTRQTASRRIRHFKLGE
jgi:transcriptional regulator with PAS, ATPase and Fis domain